MNVLEAIARRCSARAFCERPLQAETVRAILEVARWAPSGGNMQPWDVQVVCGESRRRVSEALAEARRGNEPERPDYQYYPVEWFEPYSTRKTACGIAMYRSLGLIRKTPESRLQAWDRNYAFFGAPVVLFCCIDNRLAVGSWLDYGMFIQNVCLAARGYGVDTCVQASPADYPDIIRKSLGIPPEKLVVCSIGMGYADLAAPINGYRTSREPVETFTQWHG